MRAVFADGPAEGFALDVPRSGVYVAVIDGRPVLYPEWPDDELLDAGAGLWVFYAAAGDLDAETVRFWRA